MSEQMELSLFNEQTKIGFTEDRPIPGQCEHEMYVLDPDSDNPKSECDMTFETMGHSTWTTCRKWGKCTLRRFYI